MDTLTTAVLNKNEIYRAEHPEGEKPVDTKVQAQKEEEAKPEYKYSTEEISKPAFTPAPEPPAVKKEEKPAEPKKEVKPAEVKKPEPKIGGEPAAFEGQNESKQASFENFKFAVEHDSKEEYISKTEFLQHDSIMDTVAHKKEIEA